MRVLASHLDQVSQEAVLINENQIYAAFHISSNALEDICTVQVSEGVARIVSVRAPPSFAPKVIDARSLQDALGLV